MKYAIAAILLAFSLTACGADSGPSEEDPVDTGYIQETTLSDGTQCVIADNYRGVSISCNWGTGETP